MSYRPCNDQVRAAARIVGKFEPAGSGLPFAPSGEIFYPLVRLDGRLVPALGGAKLLPRQRDR